jgi:hypothetical protein
VQDIALLNVNMPWLRVVNMSRWLLLWCVVTSSASAIPLQNITLPLPVGTSDHGTPGLLCTPTKWTDVALFFLLNYIAHAATVLTQPGERSNDYVVSVIGCLLFPVLGLYRGIEAIFSGAVLVKKDDLRKAARSGALCMVVRGNDWRPVDGEEVRNAMFKCKRPDPKATETAAGQTVISWDSRTTVADGTSLHVVVYSAPWINSKFGCPTYVSRQIVHGTYDLPEGYRLAIVPSDAQFSAPASPNSVIEVSATYNLVKALIALVQSGYALYTLYRSQGDQVEQFGYASFGLTVAPYAVMSVINLIGNLCRPDYPSLYLMESSAMDEARKRGGVFDGAVGRVEQESSAVCGCGLADGDDVEQLHFSVDQEGDARATFGTTSPPIVYHTTNASATSSEKSSSSNVSFTQHSHPVRPLPEKLDSTGTEDDSFLFIPCCDPIQRSAASSITDDVPTRHLIAKTTLRRSQPLCKTRSWAIYFTPTSLTHHMRYWYYTKYLLTFVIAFTPLAIVGAISHFHPGSIPLKESATWRAYSMQWIVWGVWGGILWVHDQELKDASPITKNHYRPVLKTALYIVSGSSAVGLFVVVGQMIARYGVCMWVGD